MSWELMLTPLPAEITSLQQLPDDFPLRPIGSYEQVDAHLNDWLAWLGGRITVDVKVGDDDPVSAVTLQVTAAAGLPLVEQLAASMHCRVIDCATGDLLAVPRR